MLLLPWVAVFGTANQTVLALLAVRRRGRPLLAVRCEQLGVEPRRAEWICAFLFAGTQLAWCAMLGDVWFIAHVAAVACTFLALAELTGRRRGWLVASALVGAAFSRFSLVWRSRCSPGSCCANARGPSGAARRSGSVR